MAGKVVGLFVDISNLYYCIGQKFQNRKLDYQKYLNQAVDGNELYRAFAYGAQLNREAANFIACLKLYGYEPKYKKPKQYLDRPDMKETRKADWDVGIAMDVVRLFEKLDIVVLGTADGDLAPLVEWVIERGLRCDILACGISRDLKDAANNWCEIDESLLSI